MGVGSGTTWVVTGTGDLDLGYEAQRRRLWVVDVRCTTDALLTIADTARGLEDLPCVPCYLRQLPLLPVIPSYVGSNPVGSFSRGIQTLLVCVHSVQCGAKNTYVPRSHDIIV